MLLQKLETKKVNNNARDNDKLRVDLGWQASYVQCCAFDFGCAGTDKRSGSYFAHSGWFFVFQDVFLQPYKVQFCQYFGVLQPR